MPTYTGTAMGGGHERQIEIVTKEGQTYPVHATCEIPLSEDGTKSTSVGSFGNNEEDALKELVDEHKDYQITVGAKTSDRPLLNERRW